jgi:hypothetical protein
MLKKQSAVETQQPTMMDWNLYALQEYIYSYQLYSLHQHFAFNAYLGYRFRLKKPTSGRNSL